MGSSQKQRKKRKKKHTPRPTFFTDRSLGRKAVPQALRKLGYQVHTLYDVYGKDREQAVTDAEWLRDGARKGWVLLTKDDIFQEPQQRAIAMKEGAKVFFLSKADLQGPQQAHYFTNNLSKIVSAARKAGPYGYVVYEHDIARRHPR